MSRNDKTPQVNIRMPGDLRELLKGIAEKNDRSMNYVIVQALKEFTAKCSEAPVVR
ncbi:MAG: Arc family DNA-binding protein [Enterobacteriaceae bacterium]|nr:Arc family DNA-binding protein [Enterobacteriaceae bacterium]